MDDVVGALIVIGAVLSVIAGGRVEKKRDEDARERVGKMLRGEMPYQRIDAPAEYRRADRW